MEVTVQTGQPPIMGIPKNYNRICHSDFTGAMAEVHASDDGVTFYVVSNNNKIGPLNRADLAAIVNVIEDALEMRGRHATV